MPSDVCETSLDQIKEAVQDLNVASPAADSGTISNLTDMNICNLVAILRFLTQRKHFSVVDISTLEARTDSSNVFSTSDVGQSSMFVNYGDDTGDQLSLGKNILL